METIAAMATAGFGGGIGIIRISGEEAFAVADRLFRPKNGTKRVAEMPSHTVHYGYIYDEEEIIDEVLLLVMRGPKTYTCENVVEIDCHGGSLVMQRILQRVFQCGARPAEPGEFTKRAFLNGRMDLSQAESVIDVINAKSALALKSSVQQLKGSVAEKIRLLRAEILEEIAYMEAAMDDPEHYSLDGYGEILEEKLKKIWKETAHLLSTADNGRLLKEGIQTVIVGKPNAGKSSLLNALMGEERAIVTEIAGTTRDTLQEQLQIGGIGLQLIDTAGIRPTEDVVEKIGVERSKEFLKSADLVLFVVDSSRALDEIDGEIMAALQEKKAIVLLNKSDLEAKISEADVKALLDRPVIPISAKLGEGVDALERTITELFFAGGISFNDEVYITNARQKHALSQAEASLRLTRQSLADGMAEDFLTIDLMAAYESLGQVIGEAVGEDLVNEIFSKFCMGK